MSKWQPRRRQILKEEANSEGGSNWGSWLLFRMERERSCTVTVLGRILSLLG